MRFSTAVILVIIAFIFFCGGCLNDDDSETNEHSAPIRSPIKQPAKTEEAEPADSVVDDGAAAKPEVSETQTAQPKQLDGETKTQNTPAPKPDMEKKTDNDNIKPLTVDEHDKLIKETNSDKEKKKGYYVVAEGDTLKKIAGKKDVYNDPLKWTILLNHNKGIPVLKLEKELPDKKLPEGMSLKIISPETVKSTLKDREKFRWVINVFSSPLEENITRLALDLIGGGYPAYITKFNVKGENYLRLRVGFYKDKNSSIIESEKIKKLINISDIWNAKIGDQEFTEFAGY